MFWTGMFFLLGGAGMCMSKKEKTGMSIGGMDIEKEVGQQYGAGIACVALGITLLYFS